MGPGSGLSSKLVYRFHVTADVIPFAATFLQKLPLTHFVAAPFQIATDALGFDLALMVYLSRVRKSGHGGCIHAVHSVKI